MKHFVQSIALLSRYAVYTWCSQFYFWWQFRLYSLHLCIVLCCLFHLSICMSECIHILTAGRLWVQREIWLCCIPHYTVLLGSYSNLPDSYFFQSIFPLLVLQDTCAGTQYVHEIFRQRNSQGNTTKLKPASGLKPATFCIVARCSKHYMYSSYYLSSLAFLCFHISLVTTLLFIWSLSTCSFDTGYISCCWNNLYWQSYFSVF